MAASLHPFRAAATAAFAGPELSSDLLEAVRRRVVALSLLVAIGSFLVLAVGLLVWLLAERPAPAPLRVATGLLGVVVPSAIVWAARRSSEQSRLINLGIALLLLTALLSGLGRYDEIQNYGFGLGWSALSVLMVLLPVLVPMRPRRAVLAAGSATGLAIAGFTISAAVAGDLQSPSAYLLLFRGDAIACGVAWAVARVVDDLHVKLQSARKLGSYELLERIGEGGMGEVWKARHGLLARPAAVKLIKADALARLTDAQRQTMLARFEREAQATALLDSPHTIEVYDFGVASDGTLYYAMELLHGIDLHEFIIQYGRLPPARVAYLLLQMCDSLAEAHAHGLIHRDIKPSNMFMCSYGGRHDFIKVLDFGLVKQIDVEAEQAAALTGDNLPGTPAFLPPEQAVSGRDVDARSDIYALGCVAYWLLTDHFVFNARSAAEFILQHVNETPIPPSLRFGIDIPEKFERLIMSTLAKEPAARPQSVEAFAAAIRKTGVAEGWSEAEAQRWWAETRPKQAPVPEPASDPSGIVTTIPQSTSTI